MLLASERSALCGRGRAGDGPERLRCTGSMIRVRTANGAVHTLRLTAIPARSAPRGRACARDGFFTSSERSA